METRFENQEYEQQKITQKVQGQDELFAKVHQLEQITKTNHDHIENQLHHTTSRIELVDEKMKLGQSDVKEHVKNIQKQQTSIESIHVQLLELREFLTMQVKKETNELKKDILDVK